MSLPPPYRSGSREWKKLSGLRIEACGASVELTHAVTLCSDLRQAIGNKWNPADKHAEQRVRDELERVKRAD